MIHIIAGDKGKGKTKALIDKVNNEVKVVSAEYQNVLLALNIADDYFKAKDQVNQMLTEDDDKDKQIYDLRHEVIEVQIKYESAQKMIEEYKEKISELQRQIIKLEAEKNVK